MKKVFRDYAAYLLDKLQDLLVALQDARLEDVPEHILEDGVDPHCTTLKMQKHKKKKKKIPSDFVTHKR